MQREHGVWHTFIIQMYDSETRNSTPPFGHRYVRKTELDVLDEVEVAIRRFLLLDYRDIIIRGHF